MTSDLIYELIRKSLQVGAYLGYRMQIQGKGHIIDNLDELREGTIFAGNHESVIDAFLMGLIAYNPPDISRVYFLGKKSALWKNRYWGKMMDYFGVIPVNRRGNTEAVQKGIKVLSNKQGLGIFPEGHIRYRRKSLEGKVGVARFAFETESPIVPVGIVGTDGVLPYGANWPSLGKKVTLTVGEPIWLTKYDKQDIYNYDALREATDFIMHRVRLLSQGYGIHPLDVDKLRCCQGLNQILIPDSKKIKGYKRKSVNKKKCVIKRFEEWLSALEPNTTENESKLTQEDQLPPRNDFKEEWMNWLNDQL